MCAEVIVEIGGRSIRCDSKLDLKRALGIKPVQIQPSEGYPQSHWPDNSCLCPCDMDATAKAAGLQHVNYAYFSVLKEKAPR